MKPKIKSLQRLGLIALTFAGLPSQGADVNWNGGSGSWDITTNWNPDSLPAISDTAVFGGAAGTVTVTDAQSVMGLQFTSSGYTLAGSSLTIGAGGINAGFLNSDTTTIGSALALSGAQSWSVGAGGTLAVSGAVTRNPGASVNFSTTGTIALLPGSGLANTNGILGGWATVGNGGGTGATADWAAVDGSGNIVTYAGYTDVGTGDQIGSGASAQNWRTVNTGVQTNLTTSATINSLVVRSDFSVSSGATMTLGSGGLILSGISRWIKNNGNGDTAGSGQITSGLASGELFVDVASSTSDASNWRVWTKIVDNGGTAVSLIKSGPGDLGLLNSNSYTGDTFLNSGTLSLANSGSVGTGTLRMHGGTLNIRYAGANVDLANDVVISGSNNHINLGVARNLGLNGTISGSGQLNLGNSNHNSTIYLAGANTMTGGTITLVNNTNSVRFANADAGNANVSWVFNNATANRNTLDFASGTISFGSMTGNGIVQSNGAGTKIISAGALGSNDTFSGVIANGSGILALTKIGSGTMTLSGNNSYSGATNVNAGTLKVSGSIGNSAVTVSNAGTVLASGTTGTLGNSVTVSSGAILAAGDRNTAGTATVNGATNFNDGSIFSWDINSTGTNYDKLISTSLVDGNTAGGSILQIVAADANFSDPFWSTTRTWADIFTTNGTTAIANWANIFSSVSVVNSSLNSITPVNGSFSVSGSTLTWSAVPEPTTLLSGLLIGAGLLRRRRC